MRRHERSVREWAILQPLPPQKSRGVRQVDDRRLIDAILRRFRAGTPWRDVPGRYGPRTKLCNRFTRWRAAGVRDRVRQHGAAGKRAARTPTATMAAWDIPTAA